MDKQLASAALLGAALSTSIASGLSAVPDHSYKNRDTKSPDKATSKRRAKNKAARKARKRNRK